MSWRLQFLSHFHHSSHGGLWKWERLKAIHKLAISSEADISKGKFLCFRVFECIFVERQRRHLIVGVEKWRLPKHPKVGCYIVNRLAQGSSCALNSILWHRVPFSSWDRWRWLALRCWLESNYSTGSSRTSDASPNVSSDSKWNALSSYEARVTTRAPTACSCLVKGVQGHTINLVICKTDEYKLR